MMNEQATSKPIRRRWTCRRIMVALGILLGISFVTAVLMFRDPTHELANSIYDQLEPSMPKSQVLEIFRKADLQFDPIQNGGVCTLEGRIILDFKFNDSDQLSEKSIFEFDKHHSSIRDWIGNLRWQLGLYENPRFRHWPPVGSDW
jgi:hypothetical protein